MIYMEYGILLYNSIDISVKSSNQMTLIKNVANFSIVVNKNINHHDYKTLMVGVVILYGVFAYSLIFLSNRVSVSE